MRMDGIVRLVLAGALTAFALQTVVCADTTVVVRQDNMEGAGWALAIQQGTQNYGAEPAVMPEAEFSTGPALPPQGDGSFYMRTYYSDSDPLSKIYLGTNNHNGIPLAEITSFRYYTYLASRGYSGRNFSGQPPQIELITDSGGTAQQRRFIFKPYGEIGLDNGQLNVWQEWDLMSPDATWTMVNTSSTNYKGNWSWVVGRYPGLRMQQPLVGDYSTPMDPQTLQISNLTGTSLSIKVGSGRAFYDNNGSPYYSGPWWTESCYIRGWVDKLVIGVNGVETVYDFEAQPRPIVAATNRALKDPLMATARYAFKYVLFGRVLEQAGDL